MISHPDDLALVQRCLAGEAGARERFGERLACIPRLLAARNRRLSAPLAEGLLHDIASDVVLQVWQRLADYNGYAAIESWLYRFCELTLCNAMRRARRVQAEALDPDSAPAPAATDAHDGERLQLALARLPAEEFEVVRAKHYEESTFEQIAARFAIPLTTAKGRYYRAMMRLRYWLGAAQGAAEGEVIR